MKKIVLGLVVVLTLFALTGEIRAAQLITNGGFETGDFSSWDVGIEPSYSDGGRPYQIDTTGDGWVVSKTTAGSVPPITNYSAMNGFDGGVVDSNNKPVYEADLVFFLSQGFYLSSMSNSTILSFDFRTYGAQSTSYVSRGTSVEQRIFSVSFLDSGNLNIGTVYSYGLPYDSFVLHDLIHVDVDVTSLLNSVGQSGTYTLLFKELVPQYYTGGAGIAIDNITLSADFNGNSLSQPTTSVPEPATMLLLGLGLMGLAGAGKKFKN